MIMQGTETQTAIQKALPAGRYTLIGVSDMMAMTTKTEIELVEVQRKPNYAQYQNISVLVAKQRGKRKLFGHYVKDSDLILSGWNLDLTTDMEDAQKHGGMFSGNALINLRGDIGHIRHTILEHIAWSDKKAKAIILCRTNGKDEPVFPELAQEERHNHVVLNRILPPITEKMEG